MRRVLSFLGGLVLGAIVFGAIGTFVGYSIGGSGKPVLVIRNLTSKGLPQVNVATDVGESYSFKNLQPNESKRTQISGRDKLLWITTVNASGRTITSEKIYVTSRGVIFGVITEDTLAIEYEL